MQQVMNHDFLLCRISFALIGNTKHWYDDGGDMSLSPHTACAYRDDDVLPVRGLAHFWGAKAAGVKPLLSV